VKVTYILYLFIYFFQPAWLASHPHIFLFFTANGAILFKQANHIPFGDLMCFDRLYIPFSASSKKYEVVSFAHALLRSHFHNLVFNMLPSHIRIYSIHPNDLIIFTTTAAPK